MGQVGRRRFLTALGASALASSLVCRAQGAAKVPRIGVLTNDTAESKYIQLRQRWFNESLARVGYTAGKDVMLEWRYAEGKIERLNALAADLVRSKVEVILTIGSDYATYVAKRATGTIPIVMYAGSDSAARRLTGSLARPGGNITGTLWTTDGFDEAVKRYEILKQAAPSAVRIAALSYSSTWSPIRSPAQNRANKAFGFDITNFAVSESGEIPDALERIARLKPDAFFVGGGGPIRSRLGEILRFALREKLISIGSSPQVVYEGGLLYYGPDILDVVDRTVSFIDRILRGANPGDLPIELPSKFELILNARTAREIGYTPPPAFQLRIDQVIE